ncbi:hypothetical protein HDU97_003868 [Phlyctochytrium planicorne]|nr:hypothetical protein HDU97_003868 [Phlyctochytrium planicorne]
MQNPSIIAITGESASSCGYCRSTKRSNLRKKEVEERTKRKDVKVGNGDVMVTEDGGQRSALAVASNADGEEAWEDEDDSGDEEENDHGKRYTQQAKTSKSFGMWGYRLNVRDYQALIDRGWRRSGQYLYKPDIANTCCPAYPIRLDVGAYIVGKSAKKVGKKVRKFLASSGNEEKEDGKEDEAEGGGGSGGVMDPRPLLPHAPVALKLDDIMAISGSTAGSTSSTTVAESATTITTTSEDGTKKQKGNRKGDKGNKKAPPKTSAKAIVDDAEGGGGAGRLRIVLIPAKMEMETFELYKRYQTIIHNEKPEKVTESGFENFLVNNPLIEEEIDGIAMGAFHQKYYLDNQLIAVGVIDVLPRCVSSVYFMYDPKPELLKLSLGVYGAIREVAFTQSLRERDSRIGYYYLGGFMSALTYQWVPLEKSIPLLDQHKVVRLSSVLLEESDGKPVLGPEALGKPEEVKDEEAARTLVFNNGRAELLKKKMKDTATSSTSVFGLPSNILDQAKKSVQSSLPQPDLAIQTTPSVPSSPIPPRNTIETSGPTCITCNSTFTTIDEQRLHFRSDWHRYNLGRVSGGKPTVTEVEFDALEELSSIEGSEDEDEEDDKEEVEEEEFGGAHGTPFLFFRLDEDEGKKENVDPDASATGAMVDSVVSIAHRPAPRTSRALRVYRHILPANLVKSQERAGLLDILEKMQRKRAPTKKKEAVKEGAPIVKPDVPVWTMIMLGSGHFAAVVFEAAELGSGGEGVIAHKTFHRYTTRKKQGGAQSSNDSGKGKANSAGAMIRRYNEQMLQEEVKDLLTSWKPYLDASTHIFIRVPARSRRTVFFDDSLLNFKDERVKSIPFTTRRPTLLELKRCFKELTTAKIVEVDIVEPKEKEEKEKSSTPQRKKVEEVKKEEVPVLDKTVQKLVDLTKKGKTEILSTMFTTEGFDISLISSVLPDPHGTSLLHIASSNSHASTVALLLANGADPTLAEASGKKRVPYEVATERDARDAFRRAFAEDPERWDWAKAMVPSPLTKEMEERQKEKEREKRRKQKEKQKAQKESAEAIEKATAKEEEERRKKEEELEKLQKAQKVGVIGKLGKREKEGLGVTPEMRARLDREKRALAAEARIRAQQKKCSTCNKSLEEQSTFEKFQFRYCSMECLKVELRDVGAICKRMLMHFATGSSDITSTLMLETDIELLCQRADILVEYFSSTPSNSRINSLVAALEELRQKRGGAMDDRAEWMRLTSRVLSAISAVETAGGLRSTSSSPKKASVDTSSSSIPLRKIALSLVEDDSLTASFGQLVSREDSCATLMENGAGEATFAPSETTPYFDDNCRDSSQGDQNPKREQREGQNCSHGCECAKLRVDLAEIKSMLVSIGGKYEKKPVRILRKRRNRILLLDASKRSEATKQPETTAQTHPLSQLQEPFQKLLLRTDAFQKILVARQAELSKRLDSTIQSVKMLRRAKEDCGRPNLRIRNQKNQELESLLAQLEALEDVAEDIRCDNRRLAPSKLFLQTVIEESSAVGGSIRDSLEMLQRIKPVWKGRWEKELQDIVEEQAFLKSYEERLGTLDDNHVRLTSRFISIIEGIQTSSLRLSHPNLVDFPSAEIDDPDECQRELVQEIQRRIFENPQTFDSTSRMKALEKTERLRSWKNTHRENELQHELRVFIDGNQLKGAGLEALEKRREEAFRQAVGKAGPTA